MASGHTCQMADETRFEPLPSLQRLRGDATLESLSADAGISVSQIWRYEQGERSPSLSHLRLLSETLQVPVSEIIGDPSPKAVPLVSWVSAGRLKASHPVYETDILRVVHVSDLPTGSWIALEIDGDSMDRIAPPGSIIVLDRNDKALVDGRFYVFGNSSGEATFKRYRAKPERLQPFSTNPDHETHYLEDAMECLGRVRQVLNYV